ncbi:MAG: hypothetical protein Q8L14_33085 [Myxococcales bacterium]|nr:hypothetical protein [Myxococcales bacterium]
MTTRAQAFRVKQQHAANPPRPTQPARGRRDDPVDTASPGVSATDRKVGFGSSGTRNVSARADKKGGAVLEDSATGKASRKSTRGASGGANRTAELRRRATRKVSAPSAVAARAKANR